MADKFRVKKGLNVQPVVGSTVTEKGDIAYNSSTDKVELYNGAADPVVTEAKAATLTNKTLSGNTAATLISGSGTLTLNTTGTVTVPNTTDTLVGKATTDTLTNKTLSGNTATNLVSGSGTLTLNTSGTATIPNATDTLVGKDTTDTLTNKTISGSSNTITNVSLTTGVTGTLPIANGGTGQTAATAAFDALSPLTTKGDIVVHNGTNVVRQAVGTNGQVLVADSSQTNGVKFANAPQGLKNYITVNADLEQGATTGYTLGTATLTNAFPSGAPTFGSGASGNLSLSLISSSQLAGTYSLGYVSSAATTAGNFVATDAFTVDLEGQAKVMQFKIAYSAVSNPSNGNFSGTSSNSFGVAIYDVTNSAWIQPAGVFNIVQSSGVGIATGTFQTTSNSTSYRLVFYNANATAGAITMYLDDFFVGPQITAAGAPVSDPVAYTPTITGFGTVTGVSLSWARDGAFLKVSGNFTTGTPTGVTASISLPSGLVISSIVPSATHRGVWLRDVVNASKGGFMVASSGGTTLTFSPLDTISGSSAGPLNTTLGSASAGAGERISVEFEVPIAGWSSNTVMSSDTDTRVVAAQLGLVTNYAVSANAPIKFDTVTNDTHAGYSASTGLYTVSVPGYYRLSFTGLVTSSTSGPYVAKNGVAQSNLCSVSSTVYGAGASTVKCVAGDTLGIYSSSAVTFVGGTAPAFNTHVSIERISGPATVAATESVIAQYGSSTATSFASNGIIFNFDTREIDSHSAVTTGASWKFTAPVSGTYEISSKYTTAAAASSGVDKYRIQELFKNGSTASKFVSSESSTTTTSYTKSASGSTLITLLAGDYIDLRTLSNDATAHTLNSSTSSNWISIRRVGN